MFQPKKYKIDDLSDKYGSNMVGFIAIEPIRKGEIIFSCNASNCMYKDAETIFNKDQINQLVTKHPEMYDYIYRYFFMMDDDLYGVPRHYKTLSVTCECPFVNHSCNPNCEYGTKQYEYPLIALRDIKIGEELCIHYGAHDTETSLIAGLQCRCQASNCVGILKFDFWRDPLFQQKYEHCMSGYIKDKVNKLRQQQQQQ